MTDVQMRSMEWAKYVCLIIPERKEKLYYIDAADVDGSRVSFFLTKTERSKQFLKELHKACAQALVDLE